MIPDTIKIGNRTVKVKIGSMDANLMGQFNPNTLEINLSSANSKIQMIETFWHELIHAINDFNRLDVELADEMAAMQMDNADPNLRAGMMEERMTENFAQVFLQVIQENNLLNIKH